MNSISLRLIAVVLVVGVIFPAHACPILGVVQDLDPTKPQLFHTNMSGGGLIEGACVKFTDEGFVLVKTADGKNIPIPLELFETSEQKAICEHFQVELPTPPTAENGTDRNEQHPWHSIRGGILCFGKIVSVQGDIIQIVDADGKLYRVPIDMLAQGALARAEKDIAKLDPKLVTSSKKKGGGKSVANDSKTAKPLSGNNRNWKDGDGKVVATGKFRRGDENQIVVETEKGEALEFALRELSQADQNYIRLIEAGAVIDPKMDSSAVSETKIANKEPTTESKKPKAGKTEKVEPANPLAQTNPKLPPGLENAIEKMKGKDEPTKSAVTEPNSPKPESTLDSAPIGNHRRWFDAKGETIAIGKFRRRTDPAKLTIVNEKGEELEIDYRSLSNDHQLYVQLVEAGGRVDIATDSAAIRREIPADKLRVWKMGGGLTVATGEFVEMKDGKVVVFQADQRTKEIPFDLLCDADKQYAKAMASGEGPGKAPVDAVVIASEAAKLVPSLDGKSLLLLDHDELKLLSTDGGKLISTHKLPGPATHVAERQEYYVVSSENKLVLLDKETFEVIGNHELWKFQKINDVALHPKRKVAFLSVMNSADEVRNNKDERNRLVMVDENNGKVTDLGDIYASWVLLDMAGDTLFAGYKDVESRFDGIHINPDGNIIENTKWDNTDILRRYRVKGTELELEEEFPNAGANGQGLVLSPNGKQVVYLSFTGYPTFSYNIALLDAKSFEKKPVTLATKDVANCKQLAIHPTKNIAAAPGGEAVVFFDTRTGKALAAQSKISETLRGCAVHQLIFSRDGSHLILQVSKGGGERFVASIPVTNESLSSADTPTIDSPGVAGPDSKKRTWTDKTGKFQVEAEFVEIKDDNVLLKKSDGTVIEVPLLKLAPKDQVLARKLASEMD